MAVAKLVGLKEEGNQAEECLSRCGEQEHPGWSFQVHESGRAYKYAYRTNAWRYINTYREQGVREEVPLSLALHSIVDQVVLEV